MTELYKKYSEKTPNTDTFCQIEFEYEEPGNIDDINFDPIEDHKLKKLLDVFKKLPQNSINEFIIGFGKMNAINPNDNKYFSCNKKYIVDYYLKKYQEKLKQK